MSRALPKASLLQFKDRTLPQSFRYTQKDENRYGSHIQVIGGAKLERAPSPADKLQGRLELPQCWSSLYALPGIRPPHSLHTCVHGKHMLGPSFSASSQTQVPRAPITQLLTEVMSNQRETPIFWPIL